MILIGRANERSLADSGIVNRRVDRSVPGGEDARRGFSATFRAILPSSSHSCFASRARPLFTHALRNRAHRGKSECTASAEIVMPRFTFHATEGTLPPNTAVLFTGGNGMG